MVGHGDIKASVSATGFTNPFDNPNLSWSITNSNVTNPRYSLKEKSELVYDLGSNPAGVDSRRFEVEAQNALSGDKSVDVVVVDYYRYGYKGLPGNLDQKLAQVNSKILKPIQSLTDNLNSWFGSKLKAEIKPIKITGEKYNEESNNYRHYYDIIKQGITGGIALKASTPTMYPPPLAFLNIKGVSEVGAFLTGSVEFDLSGNRYEATNAETKKIEPTISKFTIESKLSGCVEVGLKAQLTVAKDQVEFSASGSGKGCVSGKVEINVTKETVDLSGQFDPIILAAKVKVKSKGIIDFSLVDFEDFFAITDKIPF